MRFAAFLVALALAGSALAAAPEGRGVLLIYDYATKPFSMQNEIEPIAILLSRFTPDIQRRTAKEVAVSDLEKADRIVVAGIGGFPALSPACLEYLQKTRKPMACIGAAATLANGGSPARKSKAEALAKGQLIYLGAEWPATVDPYFPVEVDSSKVLARIVSSGREEALCWRSGNRIGFAALQSSPPLSMVFSDALLDVFGPANTSPPALLFIVQDFNPSCSAESLRRLADYFAHHGIPFAVTTQMRDLPEGTDPMPREEFFAAVSIMLDRSIIDHLKSQSIYVIYPHGVGVVFKESLVIFPALMQFKLGLLSFGDIDDLYQKTGFIVDLNDLSRDQHFLFFARSVFCNRLKVGDLSLSIQQIDKSLSFVQVCPYSQLCGCVVQDLFT